MSPAGVLIGKVWTEHTTGHRFITYRGAKSASLQASLPLIVTFVASKVWNIVRLILWHIYWHKGSSGLPSLGKRRARYSKACYDQRSILIRNSDGGWTLLKDLVTHYWRWSTFFKEHRIPYTVSIPWIALPVCLIHFAGWTVAGILASTIWAPLHGSYDQALLTGDCGDIAFLNTTSPDEQFTYRAVNNNYTIRADEYARQCYIDHIDPTSSCSYFTQRRIDVQNASAACPFAGDHTCLADSIPYRLSATLVDSSDMLGINAPVPDRVFLTKQTTCSPVSSRGRAEVVNYNETTDQQIWPADTRLYRFYYGGIGEAGSNDSYVSSWTYEFSSWKPEHNMQYDVASIPYFGAAPFNVWTPNVTFWDPSRQDADVTLIFINGDHIVYRYPTKDPTFATGQQYISTAGGVNLTLWTPEYYTTVLGCIDQYQICNSKYDAKACTPLVSSYRLAREIFNLGLSTMQLQTAERIVKASAALSTHYNVDGRGPAALQASLSVASTTQTKQLPSDQWRIETEHWFATGLAKLQQLIVDYAAAPQNPEVRQALKPPANSAAAAQCSSQRISLPAGATNFNLLGIEVLVILSFILWIAGTVAEWLVDRMLFWWGYEQRRLEWIATGPLGLSRLGYRAAGYGDDQSWKGETTGMPLWLSSHPDMPDLVFQSGALRLRPSHELNVLNNPTPPPSPPATRPATPSLPQARLPISPQASSSNSNAAALPSAGWRPITSTPIRGSTTTSSVLLPPARPAAHQPQTPANNSTATVSPAQRPSVQAASPSP